MGSVAGRPEATVKVLYTQWLTVGKKEGGGWSAGVDFAEGTVVRWGSDEGRGGGWVPVL